MERTEEKKLVLDTAYPKTLPGQCKSIIILINLCAFISACAGKCSSGCFVITIFLWLTMIAFWISLIAFTLFIFHLNERIKKFSVEKIDFFTNCFMFLAYLLISIIIIYKGGFYAFAGFFSGLACGIYLIDGYLFYCKKNEIVPII